MSGKVFCENDLLSVEGELLPALSNIYRYDTVMSNIEQIIMQRLGKIDAQTNEHFWQRFKQCAISLNLEIVFTENSLNDSDVFAQKAKFWRKRFGEEIEAAFASLETENVRVEFLR